MPVPARSLSLPAAIFARGWQASARLLGTTAFLLASATLADPASAQTEGGRAILTGVIKDVTTGMPVGGVLVKVPGLAAQVVTDSSGRYRITGLNPGALVAIEASRLGYGKVRVDFVRLAPTVTERDLSLNPNPLSLTAVTSAATADPTSNSRTPFTVAKLDADQLPVPNFTNAAASIQGKVAGVSVIPMSGVPGDSAAILIRAVSSPFKNNSPLYIVDGIPLTNAEFTSGDFVGLDIESIEVIKGASAGALYGSRAAGGVIAITTKRGKEVPLSTSQIEVRQDYGTENVGQLPDRRKSHFYMQNAALQWVDAAGVQVDKISRVPERIPFQDNPFAATYDPVDAALTGNRSMNTRVSINQTSPNTNLSLSYTRSRVPGALRFNEGFTQQNVRFLITHQLRNNLSIETAAHHARGNQREYQESFANLFSWAPDVNLLAPNLTPALVDFPFAVTPDSAAPQALNSLYREWRTQDYTKRIRSFITSDLQYRPFNWVTLHGAFGYDKSDISGDSFTPSGIPDGGSLFTNGSLLLNQTRTDGITLDLSATAIRDMGALTSRFTVKGHQERQNSLFFTATGSNLGTGFRTISNAQTRGSTSTLAASRISSGSANIGLDYAGKYAFDGLLLHEGNSRFGPDNRWNDYYRAGASWLVSEEKWYPGFLESFTLAKVRASYGSAGNQPDFADQYESLRVLTGFGFVRDALGSPALKPERKNELELGADFIWKNKVSFQLTYSRATLSDAIIPRVAPAISGFNTIQENLGKTQGETLEGTVEGTWVTTRIRNNAFRWWSNLVVSHSSSKIVELGRACFNALTFHYVCDDAPMTSIWGYSLMRSLDDLDRYAPSWSQYRNQFEVNDDGYLVPVGVGNHWYEGVTKNLWGTVIRLPVGSGGGASVRTLGWGMPNIQYQDTTDGASIRRWHEIGNSQQTVDFGIGNRFNYGNLSAYIHIRGAIGGDIWNLYKTQQLVSLNHPSVDQTGKAEGDKKPIYYYSGGTPGSDGFEGLGIDNADFAYDNAVEKNSWAKLGEVQVSYSMNRRTFPFLGRMGAERLNLSVSGQDLYTFKGGYDGLDPEAMVRTGGAYLRIDSFRYPPTRKFFGTVTVVFGQR